RGRHQERRAGSGPIAAAHEAGATSSAGPLRTRADAADRKPAVALDVAGPRKRVAANRPANQQSCARMVVTGPQEGGGARTRLDDSSRRVRGVTSPPLTHPAPNKCPWR